MGEGGHRNATIKGKKAYKGQQVWLIHNREKILIWSAGIPPTNLMNR